MGPIVASAAPSILGYIFQFLIHLLSLLHSLVSVPRDHMGASVAV